MIQYYLPYYTLASGAISKNTSSSISTENINAILANARQISSCALMRLYYSNTKLTGSVSFPKLKSIDYYGLQNTFYGCTGLTGPVNFPELKSLKTYALNLAFYGCTGITSVSFPKLESVENGALYNTFVKCTNLTGSASFPKLKSVDFYGFYQAFYGCTGITSVSFPELESVDGCSFNYAFKGTNITGSVSFPKLKSAGYNDFDEAFYGCTGITSVSFPELTSAERYAFDEAFYGCTGITGTISFPKLTTTNGSDTFNYAFYGCTGITSVSFPELTSIGSSDFNNAFANCTGLTGSVSFPKLISVGSYALNSIFKNCTGITEVHFHYSLKGNSQCTASNMGCTNATIYFDIGLVKLTVSNYDSSISYSINGESLTSGTVYCYHNQNILTAYKQGYCIYIESITPTDDTPISRQINLTTSGTTYKLNISGASSNTEIKTTFSYNGYEITTVTGTNPPIIVPSGTEITYTVKASGYKNVTGTLTSSSSTQDISLQASVTTTYNLSYPFTNTSEIFANLIDGSNFEINASPTVNSGSGIRSSIINGSKSFKINNGVSYGYIKFHTPATTDTSLLTVSITCACSAEVSYDVGAVFIDTSLHQVTSNYKFTGGSGKQDSTYGYVIYSSYGKASTTYSTYSYSGLTAGTDYYLQFAYTKDLSSNSGWDRFSITNIMFTDEKII